VETSLNSGQLVAYKFFSLVLIFIIIIFIEIYVFATTTGIIQVLLIIESLFLYVVSVTIIYNLKPKKSKLQKLYEQDQLRRYR